MNTDDLHKDSPFRDPVKLAEAAAIFRRALARPDPIRDAAVERQTEVQQQERAS